MASKTCHLEIIATDKRWYSKKVIHIIGSTWNKSVFWMGEGSMVTGYSRSRWVDFLKKLQRSSFLLLLNYELSGVIAKKANVIFFLPPFIFFFSLVYIWLLSFILYKSLLISLYL